jgi:hypothetical protein
MRALHLMHDIVDSQLVDRHLAKIGRVDGLVLELREGEAPRVAAILTGGTTLAERLGRHPAALARWLRRLWMPQPQRPAAIPFSSVRVIGRCMQLDIDAADAPAMALELWLRAHVTTHIPGAE